MNNCNTPRTFIRFIVTIPIYIYQWVISPFLGQRCRFYPSCSNYCIDAIHHYGVVKGLFYACYRLLRCHPFAKGGYDPILK